MHELRIVTFTMSDTRTEADDESGHVLGERLAAAGFRVLRHTIVREDPGMLGGAIGASVDDDLDAIIITGGTGLSPRDRTVEALLPMFQKRIDGFGEAFRRLSFDAIGPRAILSNAVAGIVRRCVVIALPGSVNAVRLAIDALVAPTLTHAVALARGIPHGHGDAHETRGEHR